MTNDQVALPPDEEALLIRFEKDWGGTITSESSEADRRAADELDLKGLIKPVGGGATWETYKVTRKGAEWLVGSTL